MALLFFYQISIAIFFIMVFWGWGKLLLKKNVVPFHSQVGQFFIECIVGMSFSIIFIFLVGIAHMINIYTLSLLIIGLYGCRYIRITYKSLLKILLIFVTCVPFIYLTFYPPMKWDDISYHLPIADSILKNGSLSLLEDIRYPTFPVFGEMLFVIGLFFNNITAQLMSWLALFFISIGCYTIVEKKFSPIAGALVVLLLLLNPAITTNAAVSYIDMILSLFVLASIYASINYYETKNNSWLYILGFILGVCSGIKYTALLFPILIGIIMMFQKQWKSLLKLTIIVSSISLSWILRNIFYTSNPVWPFLSNIFGYSNIWSEQDYFLQFNEFSISGTDKSILGFFKIPWYLSNQHTTESISIILWIGLLLAILFVKKEKIDLYLFYFFGVFTAFWFFSINLARYYFPIVPILCILSSIGYFYVYLQMQDKKLKIFLYGISMIYLLVSAYQTIDLYKFLKGTPPITEASTRQYLTERIPTYKATEFASQLEGKTYGLLNENLYFYGKGKVIGDWFGRARYWLILDNINNPVLIFDNLKKLDVNYLLINKTRLSNEQKTLLQLDGKFIKIYDDNNAVIYQLSN